MKPPWFHGWNIVAVGFLAQMFAVGLSSGSFSVFVLPLERDLGASRFGVTLIHSFLFLGMVLLAPLVQVLISKTSLKICMLVGICSLCLGLSLMSTSNSLYQVIAIYALLIAAGTTFAGTIPSSTLVVNWFSRLRGRAMGISTVGASLGGFLAPPVAALLILHLGWRHACLVLALACALLMLPLIWRVIDTSPQARGLYPDGATAPEQQAQHHAPGAMKPLTAAQILSQRTYWIVACLTGLGITIQKGVLVNLVPLAVESGHTAMAGAYLVSALTASMVVGKIVIGAAADRIESFRLFFAALLLCAIGVCAIAIWPGYFVLMAGSVLLGVGSGGFFPLLGLVIGEHFPRAMFAKVMGLLMPAIYLITIPGAPLAGYLYDRTGSYQIALWVYAAILAMTAVGALMVQKKR
ncbi:MAG: MFS transporter [Porticoccaceae bacterium]